MKAYFSGGRGGQLERGAYRFYTASNLHGLFSFRARAHVNPKKRLRSFRCCKNLPDLFTAKVVRTGVRIRPARRANAGAINRWLESHRNDWKHMTALSIW